MLYRSGYPQLGFEHDPKPAPGCPEFKYDPILDRDGPVPNEVPQPGLHLSQSRRNRVVWWDANVLQLKHEEPAGLESSEALSEDGDAAPKSIAAWERWAAQRAEAQAEGSVPTMRVKVARELEPVAATGTMPLEKTSAPRQGRPAGRRFGEFVHAVLAVIPLEATRDTIAATAAIFARQLGATPRETDACLEAVEAALTHPRLVAARSSPDVRREVAIVDFLDDGTIVEGVVDLAYELDGVWWVVEFKTDAAIAESLSQYEAQTQAYVRAITAATGKVARGVLLNV